MGYLSPCRVQGHFGIIRCTCDFSENTILKCCSFYSDEGFRDILCHSSFDRLTDSCGVHQRCGATGAEGYSVRSLPHRTEILDRNLKVIYNSGEFEFQGNLMSLGRQNSINAVINDKDIPCISYYISAHSEPKIYKYVFRNVVSIMRITK